MPAFRPQGELEALGLGADRVGQPEHGVLGAVVAGQADDFQIRVVRSQRAQVGRVGAAERIDGLRIVAHTGQALAIRAKQPDDVGLDRVDVLVLVHQDGVEHAAQHRARGRVRQRGPPQQQQVVEVDQAVLAFVRGVGPEQARELGLEAGHPRELGLDHFRYRGPGVHAPGVDVRAGARPGRPALAGDQAVLGAQGVHEVGDVGRVDDAELRGQRERLGVRADDLVGHGVEGAAHDPVGGARAAWRDPGQHVVRGPAGERQQQDPAGRRPLAAQPARPGHQGPGLAGARPGQDEERPGLLRGRPPLVVVEPVKDIRRFEHEDECNGRGRPGRDPTPGEAGGPGPGRGSAIARPEPSSHCLRRLSAHGQRGCWRSQHNRGDAG